MSRVVRFERDCKAFYAARKIFRYFSIHIFLTMSDSGAAVWLSESAGAAVLALTGVGVPASTGMGVGLAGPGVPGVGIPSAVFIGVSEWSTVGTSVGSRVS